MHRNQQRKHTTTQGRCSSRAERCGPARSLSTQLPNRAIPCAAAVVVTCALTLFLAVSAFAQVDLLELYCTSCGYRERFIQGSGPGDRERNIQQIIVVCERAGQIRNIKIPIDPKIPVQGEPLLAKQDGTGRSQLLGEVLPRFLVPGNTCALFPISAYLERNICPIDGRPGIQYSVLGQYE